MQTVVVFLLLGLILASAHLCLLFPPQREGFSNINSVGARSCFKMQTPCGFDTPLDPTIALKAATPYNITFQKNENHWTAQNPGYFEISFSPRPVDPHFKPSLRIPDTNTSSLTIYTGSIRIPRDQTTAHGVLQVKYVTNVGLFFYQCADLIILPA